jgi:hypothetical protein
MSHDINTSNTGATSATVSPAKPGILLACGVIAGPLFVAVAALSLGDLGWIQITNFVVAGLLSTAFSVWMWPVPHPSRAGKLRRRRAPPRRHPSGSLPRVTAEVKSVSGERLQFPIEGLHEESRSREAISRPRRQVGSLAGHSVMILLRVDQNHAFHVLRLSSDTALARGTPASTSLIRGTSPGAPGGKPQAWVVTIDSVNLRPSAEPALKRGLHGTPIHHQRLDAAS